MSMRSLLLLFALATPQAACGGAAKRVAAPGAQAVADVPGGPRALVRTARLEIEVDDEEDFDPTLDRIEALAGQLKGYVSARRRDAIDFRVPAPQLDAALAEVIKLGEVTRRDVRAVDVTAQVTDLKVRIDNLKTLRARLNSLVERAEKVADLLALEKELARVTSDLERLEAQQRSVDRDVAYSAISVRLDEEISPGPLGWIPYGLFLGVKWLFVWD